MLITTMQLMQMVVGIVVTVASVVYHANGHVCYTNLFNSALGLIMYASYFVLFLQLFIKNYVLSGDCKKTKVAVDVCKTLDEAGHATNTGHSPAGVRKKQ